jgi:phosphatidylglycerol:prolipoprotein diacylglycerol transferase
VAIWLGKKEGLDPRKIAHLVPLLAVLILVGGRAFFGFQHWGDFRSRPRDALDLSQGGQVFYGGLMLALPGVIVYCRYAKMPWRPVLDLIVVGAPLGLAFGRVGCFCRGCCYGRVTDLPWGVSFPPHVDVQGNVVGSPVFLRHVDLGLISESAAQSLAVHPSQLYAVAVSLAVFGVMLLLWRSGVLRSSLILAYLLLYSVSRFALEFTRDNEMAFWGLTIPQVVSAGIFGVAATILLILWHRSRRLAV